MGRDAQRREFWKSLKVEENFATEKCYRNWRAAGALQVRGLRQEIGRRSPYVLALLSYCFGAGGHYVDEFWRYRVIAAAHS